MHQRLPFDNPCNDVACFVVTTLGFKRLQCLRLINSKRVTDAGVSTLASGDSNFVKGLLSFTISWCFNDINNGLAQVYHACSSSLVYILLSLLLFLSFLTMHLNNVSTLCYVNQIVHEPFAQLFAKSAKLRKLQLRACTQLRDSTIHVIARNCCSTLTKVAITKCPDITEAPIIALIQGIGSTLNHLDLAKSMQSASSDQSKVAAVIAAIAEYAPNIQYLDLSGWTGLTDDCLLQQHDTQEDNTVQNKDKEREIEKEKEKEKENEAVVQAPAYTLTTAAVQQGDDALSSSSSQVCFIARCYCLTTLRLKRCKQLTDRCLVPLFRSQQQRNPTPLNNSGSTSTSSDDSRGSIRGLREVNLKECGLITDATVIALANSSPELKRLSLHNCQLLTDDSIAALSSCCTRIKSLKFSHLRNLKNPAFGFPKLRRLQLSHNTIPNETLKRILCEATNLEALLLEATKVDDVAMERISAVCQGLRKLQLDECPAISHPRLSLPNVTKLVRNRNNYNTLLAYNQMI